MNRFRKVTATLAVGIAAAFVSAPSSANVIDFEHPSTTIGFPYGGINLGDGFSMPGSSNASYSAGVLTHLPAGLSGPRVDRIPGAYSGENFALNARNRLGGIVSPTPVAFESLWVHADRQYGETNRVRFQGLDGLGGNVLYSKELEVSADWQQVLFLNWTGVSVLTWNPLGTSANVGIDDVAYRHSPVNVVPLPAGLPLLVGGLGLLGWLGRRSTPSKA